jgi:formylglycine-generating enzyme required for sulfatase activity
VSGPQQFPTHIGKYELEEYLGGGMSRVYRARDTVIGRTVAIKILTEEGCADAETKTRFLREARMAGNITHENVISIYDFGEDEQHRPYMVMEFLRGEDLRHAIKAGHTGDLTSRLRIALQVARAIGFIHTQKIIHRDIKPENIHITPAGMVKLMDFGIAKTEGFNMTRAGYVMGTPYYMAPEQVMGQNITESVDIYAFGILFFELMTGARPFTGDSVERIFFAILNDPVNLEPLKQNGAPEPAANLIARCTAKDPAQRPANFALVAEEIEQILSPVEAETMELPAAELPPAPAPAKRPWLPIAIGAAALVVIIAVAVFALRSRHGATGGSATGALSPMLSTPTGEMVLIPAGNFLYGKDRKPVTLPAYYIDQAEVRAADYLTFAKATEHAVPAGFPTNPDDPAVNITIDDARQFATWAHKRLPTNQEWEKAARGTGGWPYPWGKDKDPTHANVRDNRLLRKHDLMPVRSFDTGASPFHVLQMVGNVWEYVDEPVKPGASVVAGFADLLKPPPTANEPWYRARGESYAEPLAPEVMYDASTIPARWKDRTIGFRCVMDPPAQ